MFQRVSSLLVLMAVVTVALVAMPGCGPRGPVATPKQDFTDVNFLMSQLDHEKQSVRLINVRRLGELGAKAEAALPKLREMAENDPHERVRAVAAETVQKIQGGN